MRLPIHPTPQRWNAVARFVIRGGGLLLVAAVLAILIFVAREALPLFLPATARETQPAASAPHDALADPAASLPLAAGVDAERGLAFAVLPRETVFFRSADHQVLARMPHPFGSARLSCADYDARHDGLAVGTDDGRAAFAQVGFDSEWRDGKRHTTPRLRWRGTAVLDSAGSALVQVAGDRDEDGNMSLAGIARTGRVAYVRLDAVETLVAHCALDTVLGGAMPTSLALSLRSGFLAVGTQRGTLYMWNLAAAESPSLEDHLRVSPAAITALRSLLGDQTLVVGTARGEVSAWFRVRYVSAENQGERTVDLDGQRLAPGQQRTVLDREYGRRLGHVEGLTFITSGQPWTHIRDFDRHPYAIVSLAASPRGREFVSADSSGTLHVNHSTSDRTLLVLPGDPGALRAVAFAPKADGVVAVARDGRVHDWSLHAPHPEASVRTLFGPVWYEGYVEPRHVWQSTGGSDDFEPKLGLVPLLLGTLKGTFYALLFSVPIAVLAALYVSQLAPPGLRAVVKPVIELMAAMPSVVVGFLAALWLAPRLQWHLGAALAGLLALPIGLAVAVACWYLLPRTWRQRSRPGAELLFLVPFLVLGAWLGTHAGGPLEAHLFAGDLKQWLFDRHGVTFDQRNCIVVGIALGFAVIPIIFTISEDAMAAVPRSLTSGALALGASRWQSALHVVLPAASPGIFAAVMLGLGRAIGETMIVLMATGNTPILDFSPFNGMRTMSAGIAVEIPEAPHAGTLYRVLFLTGFLLFCFTFLLNTGADLVGRRLRKRYGQF